jgi:hypothetical protein
MNAEGKSKAMRNVAFLEWFPHRAAQHDSPWQPRNATSNHETPVRPDGQPEVILPGCARHKPSARAAWRNPESDTTNLERRSTTNQVGTQTSALERESSSNRSLPVGSWASHGIIATLETDC